MPKTSMEPLQPPASHFAIAAQGWLELGNAKEACAFGFRPASALAGNFQNVTRRAGAWRIDQTETFFTSKSYALRSSCNLCFCRPSIHARKNDMKRTYLFAAAALCASALAITA